VGFFCILVIPTTNLDRHWRESRREEKRLRGRREIEA